MVLNHNDKARILWEAFKERLGRVEFQDMEFDLQELLQQHEHLDVLETPFTREEIDQVVCSLPSDKSPGPDGFNTDFMKRCWPIIKEDFYELCFAF